MFRIILLIFLIVSPVVQLQAGVDQRASAFVLCKHQKSVRTIRILQSPKGLDKCTVTYTKGGTEEVLGAYHAMSTCQSILVGVRGNLESSDWNCRSVHSAAISTSSEVIR